MAVRTIIEHGPKDKRSVAVALDWPMGYDRPNPHESVRAMQDLQQLPRLDRLFGLQFFSVSSARGYTTAGSFLRFLLDRHGPDGCTPCYGTQPPDDRGTPRGDGPGQAGNKNERAGGVSDGVVARLSRPRLVRSRPCLTAAARP